MVNRPEQDQIKAILVQAIANICRRGLTYNCKFSIEGLLGITLDEEDVFLVNIKETVHQSSYGATVCTKSDPLTQGVGKPSTKSFNLQAITGQITDKQTLLRSIGKSKRHVSSQDPSHEEQHKRHRAGSDYDKDQPQDLSISKTGTVSDCDTDQPSPARHTDYINAMDPTSSTADVATRESAISDDQQVITVEPASRRRLWGSSRRSKPRKSHPRKVQSMPVFPDQHELEDGGEVVDFGRFLSMKPILRDIDDTDDQNSKEGLDISMGNDIFTTYKDRSNIADADKDADSPQDSRQLYIDMENNIEHNESENGCDMNSTLDVSDSLYVATQKVYTKIKETTVNGESRFGCTLCEMIFSDREMCQRHMRWQHKAKVYSCEICSRGFWHQSEYAEHKAVFHEGPGGYPCDHCGKVLLSKRGLKEHVQHHTGQYPFFCVKCNRGFCRKFEYTGHRRKHHPEEVE